MHLAATTSQVFHFHSLLLYHFSSTLETFLYPYLLLSLSRYVDMIANPEVAETFRKRAKVSFPFLFQFFSFVIIAKNYLRSSIAYYICFSTKYGIDL